MQNNYGWTKFVAEIILKNFTLALVIRFTYCGFCNKFCLLFTFLQFEKKRRNKYSYFDYEKNFLLSFVQGRHAL